VYLDLHLLRRSGASASFARVSEPAPLRDPLERHSKTPAELLALNAASRAGRPYLCFRDADGALQVKTLSARPEPLRIGRSEASDICLHWDARVSSVHAELACAAAEWLVIDDGMSKNGTFVNGERVRGRRRLRDDDRVRVGQTLMQFKVPAPTPPRRTLTDDMRAFDGELSDKRRRVLIALCRPRVLENRALTASNQEIADECALGSLDAVKQQLTSLYRDFRIDHLPQREKRQQLAELAIQHGVVGRRDYP
jgi:hypothetical protein